MTLFQKAAIPLASVLALGTLGAFPAATTAANTEQYQSNIQPLNRTSVTGTADLSLEGQALKVQLGATGLTPNQIHAVHIHGKEQADAECPTTRGDDANNDGFLSVFEGAPDYGPIKVNLTSPQTPFGPPARADLFFPFAGTPDDNAFSKSNVDGVISLDQTYTFDLSNQFAAQAFESVTPLEDQHIVVHGDFAPESVDMPGADPNKVIYDKLLPVACGPITKVGGSTPTPTPTPTPSPEPTDPANGALTGVEDFSVAFAEAINQFDVSVNEAEARLAATQLGAEAEPAVRHFTEQQQQVQAEFNATVKGLKEQFKADLNAGVDPQVAEDRFVSQFDAARNQGVLGDQLRNDLIDVLNQRGGGEAKDNFVGSYSSARDRLGSALERIKGQLGTTINNS